MLLPHVTAACVLKKADQPSLKRVGGVCFTFPDYAGLPTTCPEFGQNSLVSCPVFRDFPAPVVDPAGRETAPTTVVTVPKAAMYEDDLASGRKHEVGPAWKIPAV